MTRTSMPPKKRSRQKDRRAQQARSKDAYRSPMKQRTKQYLAYAVVAALTAAALAVAFLALTR